MSARLVAAHCHTCDERALGTEESVAEWAQDHKTDHDDARHNISHRDATETERADWEQGARTLTRVRARAAATLRTFETDGGYGYEISDGLGVIARGDYFLTREDALADANGIAERESVNIDNDREENAR